MPENVSFKVYLLPDPASQEGNEPNEVRRFVVDREVSTSFTYLQEKLVTVFPSLGADVQFSVSWTDLDGDKVIIASDEELIIALTEMTGPVYKLAVTIKPGKRQQEKTEGDNAGGSTVHPGVTCDSCDKEIKGFRYKCVVCDDYDLCSTCEGAGKHPGHNMMRISSPEVIWPQRMFKRLHKMQERAEQRSRCRSAAQERNDPSKKGCGVPPPGPGVPPPPPGHGGPPPPPGHGPPPPPHGGGWFGGGRGRGMFRGGRGMHGMRGMGGGCGFGDQNGAWSFGHNGGVGAWAGPAFDAMMRGWMGEQFTGTSTSTTTNSQTNGNQNQSAEAGHEEAHTAASEAAKDAHEQAHAAAQEAAYAAASAAEAAEFAGAAMSGMASPADYLQNVGNFVAAALDPLGIDVQVDIESPDGTRNPVKPSSSNLQRKSESDMSMTPSDDEDEWTVVSEKKSKEKTVEIPIQIIGKEKEKEQLYPTLPEETSDEEKNNSNTMESPAATAEPVAVQSMTTVFPGTTSVATPPVTEVAAPAVASHPDPKIQVALQAMMNMGFSNEGGWLANLLEAKSGDVGKVLDILQPVKK